MGKKSLIFLFVSLFIIISSLNIVCADSWTDDYYYQSHKEWYQYHTFNATIIAKDTAGSDYRAYLVKVNDDIFYIQAALKPGDFYIGDKITIYGNAINEERNKPMSGWSGNDKYHGKRFPFIRLGYKPNNPSIRLADGFVGGQSSSNTNKALSSMSILKATITSGKYDTDKTNCTVFVGKGYAGESVKISVLYSENGKNLNKGLKIDKTVSNSGKIKVHTLDGFKFYPDKAIITIYDSNGKKLDKKTVTLEPNTKPQHFNFA